jgi:paraquat-inducible protein B
MGEPTDRTSEPPPSRPPAHRSHRSRIPLVWVVPAVAAVLGVWLAARAYLDHGPTITVSFLDAEGLEANRTMLRFRNVDIGVVEAVTIASDRRTVEVTIRTQRFAAPFFVADDRIWIVRPRLGVGGVSGLGTLFSGPYVALDVGASNVPARRFRGLEAPPVVTGFARGREYLLESADPDSLQISTPVYFHRIAVGRVSSIALNPDGHGVAVRVFIEAPYDRFVTEETRFWKASGVEVDLNSDGLHVQTESLAAILSGGIAFDMPPDAGESGTAPQGWRFALAANRAAAMQWPKATPETFILYFDESLRGLSPGAAVELRGIPIGEVVAVNVVYDHRTGVFRFPVLINVYPAWLRSRAPRNADEPDLSSHALFANLIAHGLRAQLQTASLVTGQLYVALDFFPHSPGVPVESERTPMPLPTVPGGFEQIQRSLAVATQKLAALPLDQLVRHLDASLTTLNTTLHTANQLLGRTDDSVVPEITATLRQTRGTLLQAEGALKPESPLQADLNETLRSVTRAADSIRVLTDYLDEHPEALIRGKAKDPP